MWKSIEYTGGKYEVSEYGLVRTTRSEYRYKTNLGGNIVKPTTGGKKEYLKINMRWRGGRKTEYVHRLVAQAFVPNPDNKPHVNHKDGNKLNNHYLNLEWCTPQENNEHGYVMGLLKRGRNIKPYVSQRTEWSFYKPIIDVNTGVFLNVYELAPLLGEKPRYLLRMLRGDRKNKYPRYQFA